MNTLLFVWLGVGLPVFADLHFWQWRFYAVVVPAAVIDAWVKQRADRRSRGEK